MEKSKYFFQISNLSHNWTSAQSYSKTDLDWKSSFYKPWQSPSRTCGNIFSNFIFCRLALSLYFHFHHFLASSEQLSSPNDAILKYSPSPLPPPRPVFHNYVGVLIDKQGIEMGRLAPSFGLVDFKNVRWSFFRDTDFVSDLRGPLGPESISNWIKRTKWHEFTHF